MSLWSDVTPGMARLATMDVRLATLTNSSESAQKERLEALGIATHFEAMMGVQSSGAYRQDKRTFISGLERMNATAEQTLMVACHPWDLMGARAVGMQIAFLERPGTAWYPLAEEPDYHVKSVEELADLLAQQ